MKKIIILGFVILSLLMVLLFTCGIFEGLNYDQWVAKYNTTTTVVGTTTTAGVATATVGGATTTTIVSGTTTTTTTTTIAYSEMVSITSGNYIQSDGTYSFSHTISDFLLGKYEVTYDLWYTVYQWAISNGYSFANPGREGNDGTEGAVPTTAKYEPVTTINWRDAIVWCNAYSEMKELTPCYTYLKSTIRDSGAAYALECDDASCDWIADGYRLPTEGEWQYAASNKGVDPPDYASGANANYSDGNETKKVSWCSLNSVTTTHVVGTTTNSSALTMRDVSGNVWEWCWDWYGTYPVVAMTDYRGSASGINRILRGGSWNNSTYYMQVGLRYSDLPDGANGTSEFTGFRVARTQ